MIMFDSIYLRHVYIFIYYIMFIQIYAEVCYAKQL